MSVPTIFSVAFTATTINQMEEIVMMDNDDDEGGWYQLFKRD